MKQKPPKHQTDWKYSNNATNMVKALDSQSRDPMLKTTGLLQGWLNLSSFRGR